MDVILSSGTSKLVGTLGIGERTTRIWLSQDRAPKSGERLR
jgi:hypothetical protein